LMSTVLFGVGATDAVTFGAAAAFLLVVALLACVVPAKRATGLQPARVLRSE
jgi:putative ABC transport system permease protein